MRVLGISRSLRFSPNSGERDEAIFQAVGQRLLERGHEVCCCSEDQPAEMSDRLKTAGLVYTMARDKAALRLLEQEECRGVPVVNSPRALLTYTRGAMFALFTEKGLPVPKTWRIRSEEDLQQIKNLTFPLWIKRSDECAQVVDDVRLVENVEELHSACRHSFKRGVGEILLCEHIEGHLFKFYGVEGTDFFQAFPIDGRHGFSKFGLEHVTDSFSSGYDLDKTALQQFAERAAGLWGISVYGGDAVVGEKGLYIIDFNDWPSFSSCREAAADAIVKRLLQEYEQ